MYLRNPGFSPKPPSLRQPWVWWVRQKYNLKIYFEYLKYRRRLKGYDLSRYIFSGPQANRHIRPVTPNSLVRPLKIFAYWKHSNWENYNLLPALQTLGEVTHFDPLQVGFDPSAPSKPNLLARDAMQDELWRQLASKQNWGVLFFYASGAHFSPEFVKKLQTLDIPMINLGLDDVVYFEDEKVNGVYRGNADIARYFTVHCTSSIIGFVKALAAGATPYYLPGGANPDIYQRLPDFKRDLDVVFIGARFYDRDEVIDYLQLQGIKIQAYGMGWLNGVVTNQQQIELLNRAKIVLGFNRYSGSDWLGFKGRDFEVPMTGAFHLVNNFPDLSNAYAPGIEVGVYNSKRDLLSKIRHYLSHPAEREQIARAGWLRATAEHTWQARFKTLFEKLGLLTQEAP